jgi:hypothetical protein
MQKIMKKTLILSILILFIGCYTQIYFLSLQSIPLYARLGRRWYPKYRLITYKRNRHYRRNFLQRVADAGIKQNIIINVQPCDTYRADAPPCISQ